MQTCYCPFCGKSFVLADSSCTEVFCQHCGKKIILSPSSSSFTHIHTEHTERYVDEAELQRAKNEDRIIGAYTVDSEEYRAQKDHERQMEIEERQYQRDKEEKSHTLKFSFGCVLLWLILMNLPMCWGWINDWHEQKLAAAASHAALLNELSYAQDDADHLLIGEVRMPSFSDDEDARDVLKKLRGAGFTNIVDKPEKLSLIDSLKNTFGFETHNNHEIIEVTVDGAPTFKANAYYPMSIEIVVSYYITE